MKWYVLYTKPRNEKKLAATLTEKGFIVYCPVQETVKQWSDRKKKIIEPLFKSYIFICLEDYNDYSEKVLRNAGAVRFLWWQGKPAIVRHDEIDAIKNFLQSYKNVHVEGNFEKGDNVVVNEGPLRNMEGVIMDVKKNIAKLYLPKFGISIVANLPIQSISLQSPK